MPRTLHFCQTVTEVAKTPHNPAGVCVTTVLLDTLPGREVLLADFAHDTDAFAPLRRSERWMYQVAEGRPYTVERIVRMGGPESLPVPHETRGQGSAAWA